MTAKPPPVWDGDCCATLLLVVEQCRAILEGSTVSRYERQFETRSRNQGVGMQAAAQLILDLIPAEYQERRAHGGSDGE
jgi:hypothetical protein